MDYDICKCNAGWTGTNCTQYSCEHLDYCSSNITQAFVLSIRLNRISFAFFLLLVKDFRPVSNVITIFTTFLQEHGRCVALDECACDHGWTGASCALPDCSAVNQCSGKGECVASNLCRCYTGFLGASCSDVADCSEFANCSGRGVCVSTELLNVSCR